MSRSRLQANHRWGIARHAAAALAVAALLGAAPAAEAAIIYTNPEPDIVVSPGGLGFPFPTLIDVDNNAVPDFFLSVSSVFIPQIPAAFARADLVGAASGSFVVGTIENVPSPPAPTAIGGLQPFVSALVLNTTIPDGQPFLPGGSLRLMSASALPEFGFFEGGEWDGQTAFAGLKFLIGTETHFGWARLQVTGSALGLTTTLFDYAYCDEPNTAIDAGQTSGACGARVVPEPSSLLLLTTSAVAVSAMRRWRRRKDGAG